MGSPDTIDLKAPLGLKLTGFWVFVFLECGFVNLILLANRKFFCDVFCLDVHLISV